MEITKEQVEEHKRQRLEKAKAVLEQAFVQIAEELDVVVSPYALIVDGRIVADIQLIAQ